MKTASFSFEHIILLSYCAVLIIVLFITGCFAPRSFKPLTEVNLPGKVAIVPVRPEQVNLLAKKSPDSTAKSASEDYLVSSPTDQEQIAKVFNKVLDTLSASTDNPLQGPAKLEKIPVDTGEMDKLSVYLDDPGPLDEEWKKTGFAEFYRKTGIGYIVRVRPFVEASVNGTGWEGKVTIEAELINLSMLEVVARSMGEGAWWGGVGGAGADGGAIIIAAGKTMGRAIDQATRAALSRLFQHKANGEQSR